MYVVCVCPHLPVEVGDREDVTHEVGARRGRRQHERRTLALPLRCLTPPRHTAFTSRIRHRARKLPAPIIMCSDLFDLKQGSWLSISVAGRVPHLVGLPLPRVVVEEHAAQWTAPRLTQPHPRRRLNKSQYQRQISLSSDGERESCGHVYVLSVGQSRRSFRHIIRVHICAIGSPPPVAV